MLELLYRVSLSAPLIRLFRRLASLFHGNYSTLFFTFSNHQSSELEGPPPPDPPSYAATNIPLPDKHHMVTKHTMRDFIGLEKADAEARKAMMNFSYLSTIGNMDEAFKAIKLIKRYASNGACFYTTFKYFGRLIFGHFFLSHFGQRYRTKNSDTAET